MTNPALLDILKTGVTAWNQWRTEHPDVPIEIGGWRGDWLDLRSMDLAGGDFHACEFVYTNLDNANLKMANLSGATFYKSNSVDGADLSHANLSNVKVHFPDQGFRFSLRRARLCGSNLSNCSISGNLTSIDLSNADLRGAYLEGQLTNAKLKNATASHASLYGDWGGADFSGANLQYANLNGATFSNSNFSHADMRGTKFGSADLRGAVFEGTDLNGVDLRKAKLADNTFRGAQLVGVNLSQTNLRTVNFSEADLSSANLSSTDLTGVILSGACLVGANITSATLTDSNFSHSDLSGALLAGATLNRTNMHAAKLTNACLQRAILVETNLEKAMLTGAKIYGASVWDVYLNGAEQFQLVITPDDQTSVSVDNLEVAQFIYLLLNNERIRDIIDTIGMKGVLILGRFTCERKLVLDAIRRRLRELGFVPIMFDFDKPSQRDFTETIKILAGMSRFIVADITNPKSSPLELQAIIPDYMIPMVPIIQEDEEPFSMFVDLKKKHSEWVVNLLKYDTVENLLSAFDSAVVKPALKLSEELTFKKAEILRTRHVTDYL